MFVYTWKSSKVCLLKLSLIYVVRLKLSQSLASCGFFFHALDVMQRDFHGDSRKFLFEEYQSLICTTTFLVLNERKSNKEIYHRLVKRLRLAPTTPLDNFPLGFQPPDQKNPYIIEVPVRVLLTAEDHIL